MQSKTIQKQKALQLRKQGYSLSEIATSLNVSKSSVSVWVRDVPLSENAKYLIENKKQKARERSASTNAMRTVQKIEEAGAYGTSVIRNAKLGSDENRIICALLYWCEGTKLRKRSYFAFVNSDPRLVKAFLDLFRSNFPVDETKLRLSVHVHSYHDAAKQLRFWSKLTNIPLAQCQKPYRKANSGLQTRDGYQGCASVKYFDIALGRRIEGIAKAFLEKYGPRSRGAT